MSLSSYIPPAAAAKASDSMQYYGTLGDYIGGVWGTLISLLGFLGIVATLWNARKYEYRSKVYQVFVEMLRTHEDVVQSLSFKQATGRDVFGEILQEFYQVHEILTEKGLFVDTPDPIRRAQIAYLITFYGPHEATGQLLTDLKLHSDASALVSTIDDASARFEENKLLSELRRPSASISPAEAAWRSEVAVAKALLRTENVPPRVRKVLYEALSAANRRTAPLSLEQLRNRLMMIAGRSHFPGHQNRLGHYFRNLYVAYRYIDEAAIPKEERERLGRVIRSKLSNFEQAVLALNALTPLGMPWREGRISLVSRYMPIRAVPKGFFQFDPQFVLHEIYDEVLFEWQELVVDA